MNEVKKIAGSADFLRLSDDYLHRFESEHNLIIGISGAHLKNPAALPECQFFVCSENGRPAGFALRSHLDKPLILSKMSASVAESFATRLSQSGQSFGGCIGPIESSEPFAESWQHATRCAVALAMHQGVYELRKVIDPPTVEGGLRRADSEHQDTILAFFEGFMRDAFPNDNQAREKSSEMALKHLRNQTLYIWSREAASKPVSMAAVARESRNGSTISMVYTPPEERRRGFAAACVAELSRRLLDSGKKFTSLYTDLRNPTSNAVYQKIGYRKIGESKNFQFLKP